MLEFVLFLKLIISKFEYLHSTSVTILMHRIYFDFWRVNIKCDVLENIRLEEASVAAQGLENDISCLSEGRHARDFGHIRGCSWMWFRQRKTIDFVPSRYESYVSKVKLIR